MHIYAHINIQNFIAWMSSPVYLLYICIRMYSYIDILIYVHIYMYRVQGLGFRV